MFIVQCAAATVRARRLQSGTPLRALALASLCYSSPLFAQISTPTTPQVGTPVTRPVVGPIAPPRVIGALPNLIARTGPLPENLTIERALEEAEARSPAIEAARADIAAAQGLLRQAGARPNPELSVQVENFLGSGDFRGTRSAELSVSVNQRLDIGGRRSARQSAARASLTLAELDFAIARADLGQAVRQQFASAIAARERLSIAVEIEQRALELARVAQIFVDAGREPPLRALRARSAATQASATRQGAEADEAVARRTLAALFGVEEAPAGIAGMLDALPVAITPGDTRAVLEVRRAEAQIRFAEAQLRQQEAQRTLDPAIGIGVRRLQGSRDQALLAGFSVPIPIRDNNSGNISSARAQITAARARLNGALATAAVRATNAQTAFTTASARVVALQQSSIPEAREAARLADLSYRAGKVQLIELLDAQNALASAQRDLTDAQLARAQAAAELARATAQQDPQ